MTTPIALARRTTDTSSHLTPDELGALRARMADTLEEHRQQLDLNDTLIADGSVDDIVGHDLEIIRLAVDRARNTVDELERALDRLAAGTYGSCQTCARPIPFERLEAIPHTRYCVTCPRPGSGFR
jgi:RNA polymerase-binding transcription factor DksA